jgi:hypothetical protein
MNWKKIFVAAGFIILGIVLYLVSIFSVFRDAIGFTILLPIFLLAHMVLSIIYSIKNYSKKILAIIIVLFIIHLAVSQIVFPVCDSSHKTGQITACDCVGIKKVQLFSSQCVGIRIACYEYNQTKFEVPCP